MPKQHDAQKIYSRVLHPILGDPSVEVMGFEFEKDQDASTSGSTVYYAVTKTRVILPAQETTAQDGENTIQTAIETGTQIDLSKINPDRLFDRMGGK